LTSAVTLRAVDCDGDAHQVNLRQTSHTELPGDVDQESDLDAVGLLERDDVEGAAAPGGLTARG